jgi:hypothetical protein
VRSSSAISPSAHHDERADDVSTTGQLMGSPTPLADVLA